MKKIILVLSLLFVVFEVNAITLKKSDKRPAGQVARDSGVSKSVNTASTRATDLKEDVDWEEDREIITLEPGEECTVFSPLGKSYTFKNETDGKILVKTFVEDFAQAFGLEEFEARGKVCQKPVNVTQLIERVDGGYLITVTK